MMRKTIKKYLIFVLFLGVITNLNANNFSEKSNLSFGAYADLGTTYGGGLEFGFSLYSAPKWQLRNIISMEMKGLKLQKNAIDSFALIFHEKIMAGLLMGSSVTSYIGFAYFRPYLYISGGFGLIDTDGSKMGVSPFYYEIQAGIGHEFISTGGHSLFFELGGGLSNLTHSLPNQVKEATLGGMFKFLLGYRWHF